MNIRKKLLAMVLLPLVAEKVNVPIIAAGGVTCGRTMAAAFALGAEGVQMGTRMVSAAESPVHQNWKQAIIDAEETDTLFLNQFDADPFARGHQRNRQRGFSQAIGRQERAGLEPGFGFVNVQHALTPQ